jgi:hypothetical protein
MTAHALAVAISPSAPTPAPAPALLVQRKCATCEAEETKIQRRPRSPNSTSGNAPTFQFAQIRVAGSEALQPKLRINAPGDRYEQEADRLADQVMAVPAHPLFGEAAAATAAGSPLGMRVTPLIQRQSIDDDEMAQTKREPNIALQRAPAPQEAEAETKDEEEEPLQTRRACSGDCAADTASPPEPSATFETQVADGRSGGDPLPRDLRAFMERRLGVDLGHVRIHADHRAATLSAAVDALAFTVGPHVYFGTGQFDPASDAGRRLIAHELVHTLQQEPARIRHLRAATPQAPDTAPREAGAIEVAAAEPGLVQRADTFVPHFLGTGEDIHKSVIGAIVKDTANADLFTEVRIPGASKTEVASDRTGRADFYKVEAGEKTTIAVNMKDGAPVFFSSHKDLRKGNAEFPHAKVGAPRGIETGKTSCSSDPAKTGKKVCLLDKAPTNILLGDLKPPAPVEILLGKGQISNYRTGIANTSAALNTFIGQNPTQVDPEQVAKPPLLWKPDTGFIGEKGIKLPPSVTFGKGNTFKEEPVRLYRGRRHDPNAPTNVKGQLAVYKDKTDGIWAYEWIPTVIPQSMRDKATPEWQAALARIDALIADLTAPPATTGKTGMPKAAPGTRQRRAGRQFARSQPSPHVQRKKGNFDPVEWPKQYADWKKTNAEPLVSGKEGAIPRTIAAIVEVKERTKAPIKAPSAFDKTAKDFRKVERWHQWGGLFGRLRKAFGPLFVKFAEFYEKVKVKFEELRTKHAAASDSGGDKVVTAIFKAAFKAASTFFRVLIQKVTDNLKTALTKAAGVLYHELFAGTFVEKLMTAEADLEKKIAEVETEARAAVDERIKALIAPFEKELAFIAEVHKKIGEISKLVSAIRWGARIIQCLTPPGVGCLKLILQQVAEEAMVLVVGTCWFQRNFIRPVFTQLDFLKTLPARISGFIIEKVKEMLPIDDALKEKMFPKEAVVVSLSDKDLECETDKITKEQIELNKLYDRYGAAKVRELIRILEKGGVDKKKPLSLSDIEKLKGLLEKMNKGELTKEQIETAIKGYDPAKGFGNAAIDGVVNDLKGGGAGAAKGGAAAGGPAGGTGETAKVSPSARRLSAAQAKGTLGGGKSDCASITLGGTSKDHKKGDTPKISLFGFVNGTYVGEIYDVPTVVAEVTDTEESGERFRSITYRVGATTVFKHDVKGCPSFGYSTGREVASDWIDIGPAGVKP